MSWKMRTSVVVLIGIVLIVVATRGLLPFSSGHRVSSLVTLPASNEADANQAEIRTATHLALLQSPLVLNAAVRNIDAELLPNGLRSANDPVAWINPRLRVEQAGDGTAEVLISSDDGTREQLQLLANSIVEAYSNEFASEFARQ